jgi:hypothetical protein
MEAEMYETHQELIEKMARSLKAWRVTAEQIEAMALEMEDLTRDELKVACGKVYREDRAFPTSQRLREASGVTRPREQGLLTLEQADEEDSMQRCCNVSATADATPPETETDAKADTETEEAELDAEPSSLIP